MDKALKGLFIFWLLSRSIWVDAQQKIEKFPEFKKYQSWGYHISPVLYNRAKIRPTQGSVVLNTLPMNTMGFGLTKLINPENKISFKTGIYIEVTPLYKYEFILKKEDLFGRFNEDLQEFWNASFYRPVVTIPAFVQFKKRLDKKIVFNLETGFQFVLMQQGDFSTGLLLTDQELSETREVFGLYGVNPKTNIYPNLILSPGFYFTLDKYLIQTNFIYQKSFIAYYKGEYLFDNLTESPRSRGDYKLQGDYIGLNFNVHFLKKEYRPGWIRRYKEKNGYDSDEELEGI